jgi:hypothetical protein
VRDEVAQGCRKSGFSGVGLRQPEDEKIGTSAKKARLWKSVEKAVGQVKAIAANFVVSFRAGNAREGL